MADKAKSKSLEIEPIRYQGSVADFRAWMDGFLARAGVGLMPPSLSWEEIYKRAFEEQKSGDVIDFTRYYSRLIVRYSEVDQSSAREVWYVAKYDPLTEDQSKPPKRWATILAIETLNTTTVQFLDGIYFRFRESNGRVMDYARTEFIGEEFSSYAKFIKDEWQKNFPHAEKVSTKSQRNSRMDTTRKLHVFVCHASQDKPIVREIYQRLLTEDWIDPWLDEEKLLPGQSWDLEIEKAVEEADVVIVCLSSNSVTKEGYVQKELKFVLDIALEKPEGALFVIPLRLDDVQPPRRLRIWQYIDYFPASQKDKAYSRLLNSLEFKANSISSNASSKLIEAATPIKNDTSLIYKEKDIRVGMWGATNAGKTVYLLSMYIAAMQDDSALLIGFDENTSQLRRQCLIEQADNLRGNKVWPNPTNPSPTPELYGYVFYPSQEKRTTQRKDNSKLPAFRKYFRQSGSDAGASRKLRITLSDFAGESFLNEPPESPLWQHLAACQAILCLFDPADTGNKLWVFSNLVDFLYFKVKKEKPESIIHGQYLPHHISVCFTKMDRPEWRSMIDSPEDVMKKISDMSGLNIQRQLRVHFMPERIKYYCISSVGVEFHDSNSLKPINIFNPLNDWIKNL